MPNQLGALAFFIPCLALSTAQAAPIILDFEGLDDQEAIEGFYSGGASEHGNTGPNYGIEFSGNTLAIVDQDAGGTGNIGGEPSPDTVMFFLTGGEAVMNVPAGFDTGFSFFYSAINNPGSVDVYDALGGTGNVLASLDIPTTPSDGGDPTGQFSPFYDIGVGFEGMAMSVAFAGVQNQIAFDDITFGSVTPGEPGNGGPVDVPEPSGLGLMVLSLLGLAYGRRKQLR